MLLIMKDLLLLGMDNLLLFIDFIKNKRFIIIIGIIKDGRFTNIIIYGDERIINVSNLSFLNIF